jgi:hypothetical protein
MAPAMLILVLDLVFLSFFKEEKMMKAVVISLLLFPFWAQAQSSNLDHFNSRFELSRNAEGEVVAIRSRLFAPELRLTPYLSMIREMLLEEQALLADKHDYLAEIEELVELEWLENPDPEAKNSDAIPNIRLIHDALASLEGIDVEGIFADEGFQEVMLAYEARLREAFMMLDPTIMARLDSSTFFYQKTVGHQVLKWGLDFAKRRLSSVPVLNTASFVLVELERMMRERRHFHQNMLLHYLEMNEPEALGLTENEAARAFSSIYESRIPWFNLWDSRAAQAEWNRFGLNRFYAGFRVASNRLRNYRHSISSLGARHNFAFQEAVVQGDRVILNLFDNENLLRSVPAIAYNYDRPEQIRRKRTLMMLADFGLSFVPAPQWIKDLGARYLKSHYEQQMITEGALQAYFEQVGDREMNRAIKRQVFNPFL